MDKLVKGLALVEEVNGLIEKLQESLELFERGKEDSALARINSVEEGIESLTVGNLPGRDRIEARLTDARENLEWVSSNADRIKGTDGED